MYEPKTKNLLLPSQLPSNVQRSAASRAKTIVVFALFVLAQYLFWTSARFNVPLFANRLEDSESLCPQAVELTPQKNEKFWQILNNTFGTDDFRIRAIDWLGGAVRVP